jgi:NADH-quinone oxidoreductase subunit N
MNGLSILRPELMVLTSQQIATLMPYFLLFGGACIAILFSVLKIMSPKWPVVLVSVAACAAAAWSASSLSCHSTTTLTLFNGMMISDPFSNIFNVLFLVSAAATCLLSIKYLDQENLQHPEYYILILFSSLGMMLMASALDLLVLFISLEIMSLAVYALVGFRRSDRRSNEAAIKYFILGSAASAILLYGVALIYGCTGTTNIQGILSFIQSHPESGSAVFGLGSTLLLVGFLFKVASVPFHMWMPDVYEGAPTPITGFMTTGLKAAAFAAFIRVFISLGYGRGLGQVLQAHIHDVIWMSAVATMFIGNIMALCQTNLKRMLAYSSIAHTGYLLVGLLAAGGGGQDYSPLVMYLVSYVVMNLGAFGVLTLIGTKEDRGLNLHDLAGLASRRPVLALMMSVFLFSMAGIPPTAGFVAKYLMFYGAIQSGEIWIVVLGVLCSVISVFYYLRVLVQMYMREPDAANDRASLSYAAFAIVAICAVFTVQVGVVPAKMIEAAKRAVTGL